MYVINWISSYLCERKVIANEDIDIYNYALFVLFLIWHVLVH